MLKLVIILSSFVGFKGLEHGIDTLSNNRRCIPWLSHDQNNMCLFSHKVPLIFNKFNNRFELEVGFCIAVTNSSLIVAPCPYYIPPSTSNFSQYHSIYQVLPTQLDQVNETMCSLFNRRGSLCSKCKENYGLAAYRYYGLICVKCSTSAWKWLYYFLLMFIPPTVIFFTFIILDIKVHSGGLSAFIFFSQTIMGMAFLWPSLISIPHRLFGFWPINILQSLYGVWSLNFMQFLIPPFCISEHLTILQLVSLGYVSSVYPLVLCIVTYYLIQLHAGGNRLLVMLWRPFRKCVMKQKRHTSIESSVIHTFGTFVLLAYGNNAFVSKTLLRSYAVVELDVETATITYPQSRSVDLGVTYFGSTHAPYIALGIVGGFLTVILPLGLVLIFPTRLFPKLINFCGLRRWHAIRMFMEVFISSYKDGTENKYDCRWFAAVYLIGQLAICTGLPVMRFSTLTQYFWLSISVPYILFAVVFAFIQPHRKCSHNIADVLILLLMAELSLLAHTVFETKVTEYTLRVVFLIIMIEFALVQIVLSIHFLLKLVPRIVHLCKNQFCNGVRREYRDVLEEVANGQNEGNESQSLLSINSV